MNQTFVSNSIIQEHRNSFFLSLIISNVFDDVLRRLKPRKYKYKKGSVKLSKNKQVKRKYQLKLNTEHNRKVVECMTTLILKLTGP
jgi:virulence-associated protein VapD